MRPFEALRMRNTISAPTGFDSLILSYSPWGYWKLDENPPTSGGTAADSSPNARNGTYSPDAYTTAAGLFAASARCPNFVAANTQYAQFPSFSYPGSGTSSPGNIFSGVIFIKNSTASLQQLFSADLGTTGRLWQFRISASGNLEFVIINPSVSTTATTGTNYADGNSHMVGFTYDPNVADAAGKVKIFVDGSMVRQSTTNIGMSTDSNAIYVGRRGGASDNYMTGNASNAAFFSGYALTAVDHAALWAMRNTP
jgi:hypothetical protein